MQTTRVQTPHTIIAHTLLELGIPAHRIGYDQLCVAIPHFAEDKSQCLSTELYPFVANALEYSDWRAAERTIRGVIMYAWKHRGPEVWARYFPSCKSTPSNKRFIATLAEYIK